MHTITAQLSDEMAEQIEDIAKTEGRSKSWVIREAVAEYISHQAEIKQMTLEGLADIRAGRVVSHEEIMQELTEWGKKK